VITRHVLAALAIGIEAGDDAVARDALRDTDWILRGPARRRLERALIDAMLLTGCGYSGEDPEDARHVQRVAALDVAGITDVDVHDRWTVAGRYAALAPAIPPSRAPIATALASGALALAIVVFVWLSVTVRRPERPVRPVIPFPAGAYFHGGTPARDAALAQFLEQELTALVIETDAERLGGREGAARARRARELRDSPVIATRGEGLARAWRGLIDALDRWVEIPVGAAAFRPAMRELGRRAQDVSEQLAALGLGYYISADVIVRGATARAAILSFEVEEVAFVRAGGVARRVLSLRRLDRLNLELALLGRQGDELGDPVVLLDQTERLAIDRVLPVLDGETYRFGDPGWRRTTQSGRLLAAHAAAAIEREVRAALGDAARDAQARSLAVKQLVVATVRRHEARHAIDAERARPLRYPAALLALVGARGPSTLRTELELAAYLSQIASDPVTPQLSLWNLAGHAFNTRWGSSESYVALVVLEGLARQLGRHSPRALVVAGRLDRDALARLAHPLAGLSSESLRMAARSLWVELYGEPVLPIVDVPAAQ
jgi:hypothetical protein